MSQPPHPPEGYQGGHDPQQGYPHGYQGGPPPSGYPQAQPGPGRPQEPSQPGHPQGAFQPGYPPGRGYPPPGGPAVPGQVWGGQPPHPGYEQYPGQPAAGPELKAGGGKIILIGIVALLVLGGAAIGLWFAFGGSPDTRLSLPATLDGKARNTLGGSGPTKVDDDLRTVVPGATDAVGAVYGDTRSGGALVVGGANGKIDDPAAALDRYATVLAGKADAAVRTQLQKLPDTDPGPLGGKARCGAVTTASGETAEVCVWANNTVFGLITGRSGVTQNFVRLRGQVEHKI